MIRTLEFTWRVAAVLLSVVTALFSYRYLTASETRAPDILANAFATPFLILHVVGAATALLIAPFQFIPRFRSRKSGLHRIVGRVYVGSCLLGGATGLPLALGSTAGPMATAGFGSLAIAWLVTTWLGWRYAVAGRYAEHRRWMLRSCALTFAAVTLRLYLAFPPLLGIDFVTAYRAISLLCWVPNLLVIEAYLRWSEGGLRTARA